MSDRELKLQPLPNQEMSVTGSGFTNPFSVVKPEQPLPVQPSKSDLIKERIVQVGVSSLLSAQGVSPDDTVRAKEIGSFLDVPDALVLKDLKRYEKDYAYKKNYLTIKDNNDLLAWASDSRKIQKTSDDLDALRAISDKSKPSQSVLPYFTEGVSNFAQGAVEGPSLAQKEKHEALTWMNDIANGNPPTKFDAVKPSDSWMYSSGEFVTKFPTSIGLSALSESTNKRAIQGGIGGGVIGSALPLVGTTAGALVGSGSGAVVGIAEDQALQSAGMIAKEAYDNAINAGKAHEEAIPIAQQAMLTSWGANLALGIFPAMSGAKALVNPILGNATNSVVRTMLASGVENAVVGGVTEAVNVGAVEVAKEQAGADSLLSNPTTDNMLSALQRIGTASALGGIGGSALTGAMAGTGRLISRYVSKAPKALNHEQILTGVLDSMANSKTLVRDPETFREFTKFVLSETDFHTVDVPYDTLYNQVERNPDLWRSVFPDIDQRLETADKTGENISLDTASFLTYFQNEARELLPQILTDPDGITADDARQTLKVLPQQVQDDLNAFVERLNEKQTKDADSDYRTIIYKDVIQKLDDGGFDNNPNFKGKDKNGIAMIALQRAIGRSIQRYGTPDNALNEYNRSPFVFQFLKEGEDADARAMDAYNEYQGNPKPTVIDPNEERYKDILTFASGKKAVGLSAIKRLGKIKSDDEARGVLARLEQEGIIAPANKAGSHTVIANAKNPPKVVQQTQQPVDPIGDSVSPVEPEPIVTPEPTPEPEPAPQSEPEPPVTKVKATKSKPAKAKKSKEKTQEPESTPEPIVEPEPEEVTPSTPVLSYEKGDYWVQSRGDLGYEIYKNTDDLSERVAVIEEAGDEGLNKAKAWIDQNDGTAVPVEKTKPVKAKKEKKAKEAKPKVIKDIEKRLNEDSQSTSPEVQQLPEGNVVWEDERTGIRIIEQKDNKHLIVDSSGKTLEDWWGLDYALASAKRINEKELKNIIEKEKEEKRQKRVQNVNKTISNQILPSTERPIDYALVSELSQKWRDAYSKERADSTEGVSIGELGKVKEYNRIGNSEAEGIALLEESFLTSMAEGLDMSVRDFYEIYKLLPLDRRDDFSPTAAGQFFGKRDGVKDYSIKLFSNKNTDRFRILIHEKGHYILQVLSDINVAIRNGEIDEGKVSDKLKKTINDMRSYFVDNYEVLIEKQKEKKKQGTEYDSYRYLDEIEKAGGAEYLGRIFDEGINNKSSREELTWSENNLHNAATSIMHEAIAEGFEVYISKGVSPNHPLYHVFKSMAQWIKEGWEIVLGYKKRVADTSVDKQKDREFAYTTPLHQIFNDLLTTEAEQVKQAPEFDVKNQGEYGRITAFKDFSVIQIFQKGDVATIAHEFGHKFLDEFFFDAMDDTLTNKDTTLIEDFESTKKWMFESRETLFDFEIKANPANKAEIDKIKARGDDYIKSFIEGGLKSKDSTDALLKTILHEGWARSFEWYIKEGKAPNKGLRGTFIRFGNLIKAIYKGIKDYGVPMSPEIKLVFDRLLATDDKVNQLTAEYGIDPMFKDGATSGMDDASHTGYVKKYATIFGEISDKLRKRAMKAVTERKTRVGKEEMFAIRQRLMDESDASPEMQTFRAITEDEDLKIKPSDAQNMLGISPDLLPKEVLSEDGASPDLVAQRLGYGTAREMGQHLADLESMRKSVAGNKDINMEDARKLSVERKAMDEFNSLKDAVHQSNPEQELFDSRIAEVLTDELNHLRSLQDGESIPIDPSAFKASARKLFGGVGNKDASRNYKKYINSAKRNGKKAQEFFDKGKYDIASKYKQQQIMSMFLAKEARDFGKRVRQTERLVKRISRNKTINGVSHAHMELLHTLLNDSGITTARSVRKSREGYDKPTLPENFAKALKKFRETDEWGTRTDVYIGETLENGAKNWDNLTVDEYDDLSNTIFSIFQNGKNEGFIEIEGAKLEFDATIGQLAKLAGDVGKATPDTRGKMSEDEKTLFQEKRDKARSFLRKIIADTTKAETLFNQFDRYDPDGLWNKLNQQIQDGVEGVYNFWEGLDNIMDNFKDEVKGGKLTSFDFERWSQSLQKPVSAPDIYLVKNNYNPLTHNDDLPPDLWNPTRISLINIALHFGTPENMEKLIAGMEYTDNTKQPTGWTKERIEKLVFDNLTEIDWKFIQYLSKHVGSNWSKIVETQTKIHGFAPAEVITAPVNTPFGMIDGWYWPLVYDDAFEKSVLHEDKMLGGLFDDITPSGGTKERLSGVVKPVALDFNRVIRRVKKDVYYAHMAIPLKNMAKVLGHNKIKKAITYSKGGIYHAQLKDWVKDMANTGRRTVGEKDYVDLIQSRLLTGIYANLFGYAIKPVVDSTTDIVTAPLEFGPSSSAKAMSWLFAHRVLDLGKFLGKETGLFKASDLIFATEWHKNATPSQVDAWMSQFYTHNMRKGGADKRYMEFKNKMVNKWGLSGRVFDAVTRMGFGLIEFSEGVRNAIYARASYDSYTKKNPNATPEQVKNYVNKMIRKSSPARDIADKALIQRSTNNGQLKKMISFSTALLNRLYDDIGQAKMHWKDGKKGSALGAIARGMPRRLLKTGLSVGLVIKASLINMIYGASYQYLSGLYEQDKDDKDDAVEMLIKANIGGAFGNYPYFRDYYDVATNKSPVAGSSLGIQDSALKGAVKTTSGIVRGNKEFDEEAIVDFVEAFGSLSGLPVKRPTALFRWTDGVTSGEIQYDENDSFSQKLNDIQRGKKIER